MNHLDVVLAARALREGRALRSASVRHRKLVGKPLALVLWQLGAEPFSAAAIGWGRSRRDFRSVVAGEPRNRDLAFAALLDLARWFNPAFEAAAEKREPADDERVLGRATDAPQVVVANAATAGMLARLGRRLAYLSLEGEFAADPQLVRLGQHLQFLGLHAKVPGQQLVIALTEVVGAHWATPQSQVERQSLAALDAYIEPPRGKSGYAAAAEAERGAVGPVPDSGEDVELEPLVERFNTLRGRSTAPGTVRPLLAPIEAHYAPLLRRTWELLWRCHAREATLAEAPSVERRWEADRDAYTRHMDWMAQGGRRRTRQTSRQAAMTLKNLERAQRTLEAEEACDDPLRMIPYLLEQKAVRGDVVAIDLEHREVARKRAVRRPLLTLVTEDPCLLPLGKEMWWTGHPKGAAWEIQSVKRERRGASVVLKLDTGTPTAAMPRVGQRACFSIHCIDAGYFPRLPPSDPWTHRPAAAPAALTSLEEAEGSA